MKNFKILNDTLLYKSSNDNSYTTILISDIVKIKVDSENKTLVCELKHGELMILDSFSSESSMYDVFNTLVKSVNCYELKNTLKRAFKCVIKYIVLPILIFYLIASIYANLVQNSIFFQQILLAEKNLTSTARGDVVPSTNSTNSSSREELLKLEAEAQRLYDELQARELKTNARQEKTMPATQLASLLKDGSNKNYTIPISNLKNGPTIYVFSDPLCPYCKKLEYVIDDLSKDYSVEIFPVNAISENRVINELAQVACESDIKKKISTWKEIIMFGGITSDLKNNSNKKCHDIINGNTLFMKSLRMVGTPAVFTSSGTQIPNEYLSTPESIKSWIINND